MTKRTKKLLSLLLASAMVFTMNTNVFAEEVAVDSVDDECIPFSAYQTGDYVYAAHYDMGAQGKANKFFLSSFL